MGVCVCGEKFGAFSLCRCVSRNKIGTYGFAAVSGRAERGSVYVPKRNVGTCAICNGTWERACSGLSVGTHTFRHERGNAGA